MAQDFGDAPRPWILAIGFASDDELVTALTKKHQKVTAISADSDPSVQVRESDYDIAIVNGHTYRDPAPHLHVIQFGGGGEKRHSGPENGQRRYVADGNGWAGRLTGPDSEAPPEVDSLARDSLASHLLSESPRTLIRKHLSQGTAQVCDAIAFVRESAGEPCAGFWLRHCPASDTSPEWWWLPEDAPQKEEWIRAAFSSWSRKRPALFDGITLSWLEDAEWMTTDELSARRAINEAERELAELIAQKQKDLEQLRLDREAAEERASQGDRRLLTAQSNELKDAVADALASIGLRVKDSDVLREAEDLPLLEDLQVSTGPDWTAIVEVKGYSKSSGKTADFQKIARAATQFERSAGRAPDARWYVINQSFSKAPPDRPQVLAGAQMDLDEFVKDCGLVLDTRDLFRLLQAVKSEAINIEEAQRMLIGSVGRFSYPHGTDERQKRDA
ncbi:hypothetical protein [Pseudonocardia xishanensis]|uniref:Restriction endonuclease n=1 Tax=Pseudonocardia xishanensis TaxID=630995 RepID=A0ABP8S5T4_9PSEU